MGKQERRSKDTVRVDPAPWFCARKIVKLSATERERALVVVGSGELPIGIDLMEPDAGAAEIAGLVRAAMQRPLVGEPRRPRALRVAEPELAEPLQRALGSSIEIEVRALPVVEPMFEALLETLRGHDDDDEDSRDDADYTYASIEGVTPGDTARLFEEAARLHRAAPWDTLLDSDVVRARFDGQLDQSVCVSFARGDEGIGCGFLVFRSLRDFDRFRNKSVDLEKESVETLALEFERPGGLPALSKEAEERGWPLADIQALPFLIRFDEHGEESLPSRDDLLVATEICAIVASAVEDGGLAIRSDWPVDFSRPMVTELSSVARIRAPYPRELLPGTRGEKVPATTRDALFRIVKLWLKEVERDRFRDAEDAADDMAILEPDRNAEVADAYGLAWAAFWRPVTEGTNPIETLRKRTYAKAPVSRAAVERLAAARGTFVEVLEVEPGQAVVVRDLANGARCRVLHLDTKPIRRWFRGVAVLVEVSDDTWWAPIGFMFPDGAEVVEHEALVTEFRRCLASLGVNREEGEFPLEAPHAAFARWAGVVVSALGRLCPREEEEEDLDLGMDQVKVHVEARRDAKRLSVREIRERLDEEVPELEGNPRKLAKHQATQARVEQWLRDAERGGYGEGFLDLDPIRKELGLDTTR